MNQAQLREVKSRERWKERERVRNYECTESTLSGLSGVRYCGRSAEAAVLPRTKLVSSEHCHAPVSLRIVALPTATKPVLLFFLLFACLHNCFRELVTSGRFSSIYRITLKRIVPS